MSHRRDRSIADLLQPVVRRQRAAAALGSGASGMLAGGLVALALGAVHRLGVEVPHVLGYVALFTGPLLGVILGLFRSLSLEAAASAVDTRFALRDRTLSALDFLSRDDPNPLYELQVADAGTHLAGRDLRPAVAVRPPRRLAFGCGLAAGAALLLAWTPEHGNLVPRAATTVPAIVQAAQQQQERLEELEKRIENERDPELKRRLQELLDVQKQLTRAMQQPGVDLKQALATLSELEAALAGQKTALEGRQLKVGLTKLGKALQSAAALEDAGRMLEAGELGDAADELRDMQKAPALSEAEKRALEQDLSKLAKEADDEGMKDLAQATSELKDALGAQDPGAFSKAASGMADLLDAEAFRESLYEGLEGELRALADRKADLKSECEGGVCSECQGKGCAACKGSGRRPGGAAAAAGANSLARGQTRKDSRRPSTNFGMGTHGVLDGEATRLDSKRDISRVKGRKGAGPSTFEKLGASEGEGGGRSSRRYRDAFNKYKKLSEAVLESEPIPLGQRQAIRRYFELIRPKKSTR